MKVTQGRIVMYVLSEQDATQINRRRTTGQAVAEKIRDDKWPIGAQAHIGNDVNAGEIYPMIVTRIWNEEKQMINGQVFLDGNDTFWVTSSTPGSQQGEWFFPERV